MHMLINAVILAVTLPADPADIARDVPACSAEIDGGVLSTQVEFAGGFVVEGPWRVLHAGDVALEDGSRGRMVNAVLDRMIEKDALTGQRRLTPFAQGVRMTFRGRTHEEAVSNAAELWCSTVLRMHGGDHRIAPPIVQPLRVAVDQAGWPPAA